MPPQIFAVVLQDDEGQSEVVDVSALRNRDYSSRAGKTIFSALELPEPNKIRTATGLPGEEYWQQRADYQIDVTLDTENDAIKAVAKITYTNNSPETLP